MRRCAAAGGSKIDLAWIGFRVGNKFGESPGRERRMHRHDVGQSQCSCDRHAVADEVERKLLVKSSTYGIVRADEGNRVTVRCGAERKLHADIAAGAGLVLDDE